MCIYRMETACPNHSTDDNSEDLSDESHDVRKLYNLYSEMIFNKHIINMCLLFIYYCHT